MRLHLHVTSPFAWKVLVAARELGLHDRIEACIARAHPIRRDLALVSRNPLGQVPTLETEAGILSDSRVICEYLDARAGGGRLFPAGAARWPALVTQSIADGMMTAAVQARYEVVSRPPERRWDTWEAAQRARIVSALDWLEARAPGLDGLADIGAVAAACALAYLDMRFPELDWRAGRPALAAWHAEAAARPSMQPTRLPPGAPETAAGWALPPEIRTTTKGRCPT